MRAALIPKTGGDPIEITRDVTVVGRKPPSDVILHGPGLSRIHCILIKTAGLLVIRDLASTNGTKVNGQRVRWAALLPGDRLSLARTKFQVYLGPDDRPIPSWVPSVRRGETQPRSRPRQPPAEAPAAPPPRRERTLEPLVLPDLSDPSLDDVVVVDELT